MARAAEMMRWIEQIVAQGIRRPGYPADEWVQDWAAERFTKLGLEVTREPVDCERWLPGTATLSLWPDADPSRVLELPGFPLPFTEATAGTEARLARLADARPGDLVVEELTFAELPQSLVREGATSAYDPEGAFDTLVQTLPFGPALLEVAEPAIAAGAAGFIGALSGVPWETREYYVPYDAVHRPLPALWLSPSDALRLLALLEEEGPCTGRLMVEAAAEPIVSHNIVATLPGASPHRVIVGSHHDGPWASAVEDASGIALVLAAAEHWAAVPEAQRPHQLTFLLTAAHMCGGAGTRAYVEAHRAELAEVVLQLHLEHAARRCEAVDGKLVPTDDPEVRWWFTSRAPALESLVARTLEAEGLRRSLVLPPDVFSPMPPTDGAFFHPEGVPLVHFLSAPMYLFDPADTLDKIDEAGLEPLVRAANAIVEGTAGWTPASIRLGMRGVFP